MMNMRNLLKYNSDFIKKNHATQQICSEYAKRYVAVALRCRCVVPATE